MTRSGWDTSPEAVHARLLRLAARKLAQRAVRPLATVEDVAQAGFIGESYARYKAIDAEMEAVSDVDALAASGRRRVGLSGVVAPTAREPDDRLMAALDRLGPRQRLIVLLRYGADMSMAEVARRIGRSRERVRAIERMGLARLEVILGPSVRRDGLV